MTAGSAMVRTKLTDAAPCRAIAVSFLNFGPLEAGTGKKIKNIFYLKKVLSSRQIPHATGPLEPGAGTNIQKKQKHSCSDCTEPCKC